jgi:hypothetical protein
VSFQLLIIEEKKFVHPRRVISVQPSARPALLLRIDCITHEVISMLMQLNGLAAVGDGFLIPCRCMMPKGLLCLEVGCGSLH